MTRLSLDELAELSGLEKRTIRSWIERDLLPGPDSLGPKATYGQEHLDRLRFIQKLRDARRDVTLDQIRGLMVQLSPQQIAGVASGAIPFGLVDSDDAPSGSALAYLRGVRRGAQSHPHAAPADVDLAEPASAPSPFRSPLEDLLAALQRSAASDQVARAAKDAPWHRVSITPDIELSVRGELDPTQLAALRRIGDYLRHLLTKGAKP